MSYYDDIIRNGIASEIDNESARIICRQLADGGLQDELDGRVDKMMLFEAAIGNVLQQAETGIGQTSDDTDKTINGISPRELYDLLQDVYQLVDSVKHINGYSDQAYDVGSSVDEIMSELTALNEIPTETGIGQTSDTPFSEGDIVRDVENTWAEHEVVSVTEQDPRYTETSDGRLLSSFHQNNGYLDSDYVVEVKTEIGDSTLLYPSKRLELVESVNQNS